MGYFLTSKTLPLHVTVDGNGNVMQLVDAEDGTVDAEYEYGSFGEVLKADGDVADDNAFRFSTKYEDESGKLYYGYRYYDPDTGRWLNRDPIGKRGGLNLYSFVRNQPISETDSLGCVFRSNRPGIPGLDRPPVGA